jgi:2-(1,2-epoxy-1,2-dihydrophenyl)acetyl-CoA isomerase
VSYEFLRYECADGVARIVLDDPSSLNALTIAMGHELLSALGRAERDARAVLLTGAGRAFCSGAKLNGPDIGLDDPMRDIGAGLDSPYNPIILAMRRSEIPVVTAVRGPAAGIGCALALAADLVIASETAYFLQAFSNIGLVPDGGSSYLLSRAAGRVRAMEMMLLGERVAASRALEWGLVNRVVPDAALDEEAQELASRLGKGPRSLGMIKRIAWDALDSSFETVLYEERSAQRAAGRSVDGREGIAAFLEKRDPRFTGC